MIFHFVNYPNNRLPNRALHIDNVPIEKVTYFDFFGLRVSDTLKWQGHTNKVANKISKSIGVMSRLKHVLKPSTLVTIYNSLILLCWGFESERLVKLQKRAVRIIHRAKYNAHSEPLLQKSGLLVLKDIFSCDQAALWMVQSVCPSVCLSVCDAFFTMFPSSYRHEIFRSYYQWQKWCPCKRSRSEVKGQGHRGQNPT